DHVDFGGAQLDRVFSFGDLGRGGVGAQRESDDGADFYRRSGQLGGGQGHPVWVHAHAREAVFTGLTANFADVGGGGVGAQQGVIDLRGERGIDARKGLARRDPGGSGGENLAVIRLRSRGVASAVA